MALDVLSKSANGNRFATQLAAAVGTNLELLRLERVDPTGESLDHTDRHAPRRPR